MKGVISRKKNTSLPRCGSMWVIKVFSLNMVLHPKTLLKRDHSFVTETYNVDHVNYMAMVQQENPRR
jgi:hypothetical protein